MLVQMQAFSLGDYHSLCYSSNQGTWECADLHGTLLAVPRHQMILGPSQNQKSHFSEKRGALYRIHHTWCLYANISAISAANDQLPSHSAVAQTDNFLPRWRLYSSQVRWEFFPSLLTKRPTSLSSVDSKLTGDLLSRTKKKIFFHFSSRLVPHSVTSLLVLVSFDICFLFAVEQ